MHVFTSKGIYETSEDLWFKGTVIDRDSRRMTNMSHTVYIELVNSNDSVVLQEKFPIINGKVDGHIYVGDDWMPGEYRLYAHARNTVGINDTILFPSRILIVNDLPEVPIFLTKNKPTVIPYNDIAPFNGGLKVTITLDSTEYNTRSLVKGRLSVTDNDGNPVQAEVALSVYDCLYRYKPSESGLSTRLYADAVVGTENQVKPFLSDGVSSGVMKKTGKHQSLTESQYINVYDVDAAPGKFNIVETEPDGRFEVSYNIGQLLGRELIMKPLASEKNYMLEFDRPFETLGELRAKTNDYVLPQVQTQDADSDHDDIPDSNYHSRMNIHLDEVVVQGKSRYYTHREKLYGYLDSIHTIKSGVWVCHCGDQTGNGYINDYLNGYTHHPQGYLMPEKKYAPKIGESYEAIKYTGPTQQDYVVDIQIVTYEGERLTQEQLLKEAGLFADQGYARPYDFQYWDPEEWYPGVEDLRNTLLFTPLTQTNLNGELEMLFHTSDITSSFIIRGFAISQDGRFADFGDVVFEVKNQ